MCHSMESSFTSALPTVQGSSTCDDTITQNIANADVFLVICNTLLCKATGYSTCIFSIQIPSLNMQTTTPYVHIRREESFSLHPKVTECSHFNSSAKLLCFLIGLTKPPWSVIRLRQIMQMGMFQSGSLINGLRQE